MNKWTAPLEVEPLRRSPTTRGRTSRGRTSRGRTSPSESGRLALWVWLLSGAVVFVGCKKKPTSPENNPPYAPFQPSPADSATNVSRNVTLSWRCGDPDRGDVVYYDIYFDTTDSPSLVKTHQCSTKWTPGTLLYETMYYWKIVAEDSQGDTTHGPVWVFTTQASTNQPPNTPSNPSPADSAEKQSCILTLGWTGGDPDTGDAVQYDIYLDTLYPPPLIVTAHSYTYYTTTALQFAKRYYWRIVAKDIEKDSTAGPIWTFTTKDTMVVRTILAAPAGEPTGLAWDGEYLWVSDRVEKKLYQIDTASAGVINSFASPGGGPTGLTWDGIWLWVNDCSTSTIYKLTATSGTVIDSFASPDSIPMGLAWRDITSLWLAGAYKDRIFELNPTDGTVIRSFAAPSYSPTGLVWDGGYLWLCDSGTDRIYKVSTVSGLAEQSFISPGNLPTGLTWDGKYFWNADSQAEKIYKLELLTAH